MNLYLMPPMSVKTPLSSMKVLTESLLHMDIDDPAYI